MTAGCSKIVTDRISNLSSSQKSVVFLSGLLFDTNSSSEVLIRDNTSLIHNIAIVGHPELEHTSVLKWTFQHWNSDEFGNLRKCNSEI